MVTWSRWPASVRLAVGAVAVATIAGATAWALVGRASAQHAAAFTKRIRPHFDHAAVITGKFETPQDVTRACLGCHPRAAMDVMKTSHWTWLGDEVRVPGHDGEVRIGKRNLLNNFCLSARGNEKSCTKCHVGY